MDLIAIYKNAYKDLEPHLAVVWIVFLIANLTSFFILIPMAGFLMMLLRMKRENRKPDFADLFSQIDYFIPLLLLFILMIGCALTYGIASAILLFVSSALFFLFRFSMFLVFIPLFIVIQTHTLLLICDQKVDTVSAIKRVLQAISNNPKEHYLLGLGAFLLLMPCLLGGPIAILALVNSYEKNFVQAPQIPPASP